MRFEYVVWFRDHGLPAADQDYEWPAVFVVEAATAEEATRWGDTHSRRYAEQRRLEWMGFDSLPVIVFGREASDGEIGW